MVLKVALGVFLGIIAVLIVLHIPTWMREFHESAASSKLFQITPDDVIARCGKPLKDRHQSSATTDPKEPFITRTLFYKGSLGQTVSLEFLMLSKNDGKQAWSLLGMKEVTGFDDIVGTMDYKKDEQKLLILPCLDANAKR